MIQRHAQPPDPAALPLDGDLPRAAGDDLYTREDFVERVRAADPLALDETCARLPEMNRASDVGAMAEVLRGCAGSPTSWADAPVHQCAAAMRDLGMFLGSMKRHGVEPLALAPELTPLLQQLGARTDMVPRDTIFHYTLWNPVDQRQRRYTADGQESHLQDSVRMVLPDIRDGVETCAGLLDLPVDDPWFAPLLRRLADHLRPMVESMAFVRRSVSPRFFTHVLRPYLDPVAVAGRDYYGPAAAQVPMWLFDLALWGAHDGDYEAFWHGLVPYALPRWRSLFAAWSGRPCLVARLTEALTAAVGPGGARGRLVEAGTVLLDAIQVLVQFRGRHLGIAKQAYGLSSVYEVGSGGGSVELLRQILELTRDAIRRSP